MGGRGAGPGWPPRLGEPPPPTLPGAWGPRLWAGPLLAILVSSANKITKVSKDLRHDEANTDYFLVLKAVCWFQKHIPSAGE